MSEKNDEKWRSYALDNRNKITELEKKIEVINDDNIRIFKDIQLSLEANFKRIEKLEASSASKPAEQGVLSNEGWTKDKFPEWKSKEKEPTSSARQTEDFCVGTIEDALHDFWEAYDLKTENGRLGLAQEIDKCIRMFCFEEEILVEKEDLEWLFDNLKLNSPKQKWNELIKKYLEAKLSDT